MPVPKHARRTVLDYGPSRLGVCTTQALLYSVRLCSVLFLSSFLLPSAMSRATGTSPNPTPRLGRGINCLGGLCSSAGPPPDGTDDCAVTRARGSGRANSIRSVPRREADRCRPSGVRCGNQPGYVPGDGWSPYWWLCCGPVRAAGGDFRPVRQAGPPVPREVTPGAFGGSRLEH